MEKRYVKAVDIGPQPKRGRIQVRPSKTVRLAMTRRLCSSPPVLPVPLLALILRICARTTPNTTMLHKTTRKMKATTET